MIARIIKAKVSASADNTNREMTDCTHGVTPTCIVCRYDVTSTCVKTIVRYNVTATEPTRISWVLVANQN